MNATPPPEVEEAVSRAFCAPHIQFCAPLHVQSSAYSIYIEALPPTESATAEQPIMEINEPLIHKEAAGVLNAAAEMFFDQMEL